MDYSILRHGRLPLVDSGKERFGAQVDDLLQLFTNNINDGNSRDLPNRLGVRSGEEATQQGAFFGGAVGKFVVHKSCCEQPLAFAAGDQETETWRKRAANLAG